MMDETPERYTLVHDRYQVACRNCGSLSHHQTQAEAWAELRHQEPRHATCGELTVFDVMARRGAAELWDSTGRILAYRPKD